MKDCGPKPKDYGSKNYWDNRYSAQAQIRFDWLESGDNLITLMKDILGDNLDKRILNIGCGNSQIQDKLYDLGYHFIHNNDISPVVIQQMIEVSKKLNQEGIIYQVMDVTQMTYPDCHFDVVLDKATLDTLMCTDQPWIAGAKLLEGVSRILKPNGIYIVVSYSSPQNRAWLFKLKHLGFELQVGKFIKDSGTTAPPTITHIYKCIKKYAPKMTPQQRSQFYQKLKIDQDKHYQ